MVAPAHHRFEVDQAGSHGRPKNRVPSVDRFRQAVKHSEELSLGQRTVFDGGLDGTPDFAIGRVVLEPDQLGPHCDRKHRLEQRGRVLAVTGVVEIRGRAFDVFAVVIEPDGDRDAIAATRSGVVPRGKAGEQVAVVGKLIPEPVLDEIGFELFQVHRHGGKLEGNGGLGKGFSRVWRAYSAVAPSIDRFSCSWEMNPQTEGLITYRPPGVARMSKRRRKSNDKPQFSFPKAQPGPAASPAGSGPTDADLMNEFQAACGRNDKQELNKALFDLMARHDRLVLNILQREQVPTHDRAAVAGLVWETISRIAHKPAGSQGAWDRGRGLGGGCPFVPLLKQVSRSRARDYHGTEKAERRRYRRLEEAAGTFGADWRALGGSPPRAEEPRRRGGNLRQTQPPASWRVVAVGQAMLADALAAVPRRQRAALELHAEGMSNEEIASAVGTSSPTVSRDLTAARKTIRQLAEAAAATAAE